jgi:hypothetical protein
LPVTGCQLPVHTSIFSYKFQVAGYREYRIQLFTGCRFEPREIQLQVSGNTVVTGYQLPVTGDTEIQVFSWQISAENDRNKLLEAICS